MTPSLRFCLAGFLLCLGSVRADTVVLSTDESIEGSLVSTDEHVIRIRDTRGIVEEIPRVRVTTIRFSTVTALEKTAPASQLHSSSAVPEEQRQFRSLVARFQKDLLASGQEINPTQRDRITVLFGLAQRLLAPVSR